MMPLADQFLAIPKLLAGSHLPASCKRYKGFAWLVLLGLAGPLVIAVTPDSQHIFWSAILLLIAAASSSCIEPGLNGFPYAPVTATLPLLIAATVVRSSAIPWLLALMAVALASCWGIRSAHRKTMERFGIGARAKHAAKQEDDHAMQLLLAASHDLRQPVQALVAQVDLIGNDPAYVSPRQLKEVQASVNALSEMLNDLLDVNRINLGIYEATLQPVNVRLLLREVEQVFAVNAHTKGLCLLIECAEDVWVKSDLKLLRRILFNLVVNAIRYTDAGGIRLGCTVVEGRAVLLAEDTGKGLHVENFPGEGKGSAFELRPTSGNQGLGLGLGIVSTMALQLGHKLRVASELGEGTQIEVEFGECVPAAEANNAAPPVVTDILVAIVEDNVTILQALSNVMTAWGCRPVCADSGQKLVAELHRIGATPALIIADLNLRPDETGLDVIRALRKIHHESRIPAILLTGDLAPQFQEDAALADVRVLYKPLRPSELRKVVNELICASRQQAQTQAQPACD